MRLSIAVFFCVSLMLPCDSGSCLAQSATGSSTARRIIAPTDESQRVTLKGSVHPLTKSQFDRGPVSVSDPTGRIQLVLRRSTAQEQALVQYLSDLENPSASAFHKWLTPAQYGVQFGVDVADIQTVESWLQSHGFQIAKTPDSHNLIEFSGTIDQVQKTFHTSIHAFDVGGQTRFANVTDMQIPTALSEVIAGIGPLNNFHSRPGARISVKGTWSTTTHSIQPNLTFLNQNGNPFLFVDPSDAATIYDSPNSALNPNYTAGTSYTGKGATIGIVGVSNLYMQDIINYRTAFLGESTTSANLPNVIIDGNDPGIDFTGGGLEALLDNEVAGGLAPGAQIDFYISAGSDLSDGLFNAMARAIDDNAVDILSISFGACESSLGSSGNQLMLELAEQAAAQGISVTVSAGDNGSAGCDNFDTATSAQSGLAVNGFASTPYTIAVGGTDFDVLPSSFSTYASKTTSGTAPYYRTASQYIPEKPWNDSTTVNTTISQNSRYSSGGKTNIVAGSGGTSSNYSKPAFQTSLTPADGDRDLPDVSLLAGNGFYSATWVVCSDSVANGTGAGSPYSDCANTGGQFSNDSSFTGVGGTSASAPAFAGMLALAVQATGGRLGQADTILYQLAKAHPSYFHDITNGNNSVPCSAGSPNCGSNGFITGYNAGTGYDLATGLGSIDVAAIINNWKSVSLGSTSTSLQINSSTASYSGVHGANLTFNAGVTGSSGTPTGNVAITDNANITTGGTASGPESNGQVTIALAAGSGSTTYNGLPGGSYQVTAAYGGDTSFAASTSAPISVSISPEPSTTTLTVNAYNPATGKAISTAKPIPYGFYVLADADIAGTAEGSKSQGVATGTVEFLNGGTTLGSAVVSSGREASWPPLNSTFTALSGGSYSLSAQYSGDVSYSPSSGTASFTIAKASTTATAGFGGSPVEYGNLEQITAGVSTNSYGIAPTGTFQFYVDGQAALAPQPIYESFGYQPNNTATPFAWADAQTSYAFLSIGQHTLSASYSGDGNYAASGSPSVSLSVTQAQTFFTTFGWSVPGGTASIGQQTTATATVFGSEHGEAPTGVITFYDNGTAITGTATYNSQGASGTVGSSLAATIPYTFTSAGSHSMTALYSGDANYLTATTPGSSTVNVLGPFSVSSGALIVAAPGQSGTTVLTVTPNGTFTGTVTLSCAAPASAAETTCGFVSGTSFAPTAQLTIAGAAATTNFQVTTTAPHQVAVLSGWRSSGLVLAVLLIVIVPRKRYRGLCILILGGIFLFGTTSCGSGGGGGTGAGGGGKTDQGTLTGTYSFTVTASSGSGTSASTASTQVSVAVQ